MLGEGIKRHGHKDVTCVETPVDAVRRLIEITRQGDLVLTLGAGDVWKTGEALMNELNS
jgi:UDP-N-acetylmuramate--alanine ligase